MAEKVDVEAKTNPDGTIRVMIPFKESTWAGASNFRCINIGLMRQSKPIEMDPDMTEREQMEFATKQERDYRRRMNRARPCLLTEYAEEEVREMLLEQGPVTARLLQRIRDKVQNWYTQNGYPAHRW